jgi:hypothetical protein
MVSVLASSVVDRWFESRSALRRKSKDWSARNQDNLFEWDDMSIHGLLFQLASTIKNPTKRVALVQSGPHHHLYENSLVLVMI